MFLKSWLTKGVRVFYIMALAKCMRILQNMAYKTHAHFVNHVFKGERKSKGWRKRGAEGGKESQGGSKGGLERESVRKAKREGGKDEESGR